MSENGGGGKLLLIREYIATMRARSEALRGRAPQNVAAEALQELETAHEELTVADEELRTQGEELERVRQEIAGELRYFRDLFDHAPDGYVETDSQGVVRLANRTIAAQLNILPRFLERKPLINFVVRGDCDRFRAAVVELGGARPKIELSIRLRPRHGGAPFCVDVHAAPVVGLARRVVAIRWALRLIDRFGAASAITSARLLAEAIVAEAGCAIAAKRLRVAIQVAEGLSLVPQTAAKWFPVLAAALKAQVAAADPGSELRVAAGDAGEGIAWRLGGIFLTLPAATE